MKVKSLRKPVLAVCVAIVACGMALGLAACDTEGAPKDTPAAYVNEWNSSLALGDDSPCVSVYEKKSDAPLKVLQLTDIHYDDHNANPKRREEVCELIAAAILGSHPNVVTVTGDWGSNSFKVLDGEREKYAAMYPEIELGQPDGKTSVSGLREARSREIFDIIEECCYVADAVWAPIFGNHDAEGDLSKYDYADLFEGYPLCLFKAGFSNVKGVGNYVVKIKRDGKLTGALYMLDSHQAVKVGSTKYDCIGKSQIEWYNWCVAELSKEYTGAGGEASVIPGMAYVHVSLNEFSTAYKKAYGTQKQLLGCNREKVWSGYKNTGMFEAMRKSGSTRAVFAGHDHDNNAAVVYKGVILAYGVQSGWCDEYATDSQKGALIAEMDGAGNVMVRHMYLPLKNFDDPSY